MKGHVLDDFVAEFSNFSKESLERPTGRPWQIYVNDSFCQSKGGVGVYVAIENDTETYYAIKLGFMVTNNEVEYKAILAGLTKGKALGAKEVEMKADF